MTGHLLFDGTFSTEAVAAAAHALVQQLHDEAMATIAALAEHGDLPVPESPETERNEPVTYRDPATWSVADDEDDLYADDDEDGEPPVLRLADLPALLPRIRPAGTDVTARRFAAV